LLGGAILGFLNQSGLEGMQVYRTYFRLAGLIFLVLVPIAFRLDKLSGEWSVKDAFLMLFRRRRILQIKRDRAESARRRG
jgi:hypothetical protein